METEKDDLIIKKVIQKYISHWPFFSISIVFFLMVTFFLLQIITPKYEATASIVIKDEKKGSDDSKIMESLNMISTKKIIENEMKVIKSKKIMDSIVNHLRLYAPIYVKGIFRDSTAYSYCPVVLEVFSPQSVTETRKIPFHYNRLDSVVTMDKMYTFKINSWLQTKYGKIRFLVNDNWDHIYHTNDFFVKIYNPKDKSIELMNSIDLSTSNKLSSIIEFSYKDESPIRAENVLNSLLYYYDYLSNQEKKKLASNTLDFITNRLNTVSSDLDSIEHTVEIYKENSNASDVDIQNQLFLQNVSANNQELSKINMQLTILDEVNHAVNNDNMHSDAMMPSTIGITDVNLSKLLTELNNKELEFESLKKTIAPNNPILISIKDQINRIKPSVINNLLSQKNNLLAVKKNLNETNNKYANIINTLPKKERKLIDLSRDENIKKSIYNFLLQKREESELSYASNLSENIIINDALSSKYPVYPVKSIAYTLSFLGSIFFCVVFLSTKDFFQNKITSVEDIERKTDLPIIGEIHQFNEKESKIISFSKRSFLAEEFRKVRTSIDILLKNQKNKKILITSNISGEGKSFVALNLAVSYAMTGKNVLLIDFDLYKSGLDQIFTKRENTYGIHEYVNNEVNLQDIIRKVDWQENLNFIGAGIRNQDATEMLSKNNNKMFLKQLETMFDYIIIDSAPRLIINDSNILSQLCDISIVVIRNKYTPKKMLENLHTYFHRIHIKNAVILFNGIQNTKKINSSYYNYFNTISKQVNVKKSISI